MTLKEARSEKKKKKKKKSSACRTKPSPSYGGEKVLKGFIF